MEDQGAKLQGIKTKLYYGCKNETSSGWTKSVFAPKTFHLAHISFLNFYLAQ
jgi:hypothetical protein